MEYLATMTTHVPAGTTEAVADVRAREGARTRELAAHLIRLWALPSEDGAWHALGLWRIDEVTPLGPHPSDPGVNPSSITR